MIYQLASVNVDILMDRDVEMTNQVIPDLDTFHYYHLTITPVHINISNNTFYNVYLHFDNSKVSAHITNNVFTGAGIKISSTSTDLHQPVVIENCIFQGFYSKPIFEVFNATNVYMHSCVFNNSKLLFQPVGDNTEGSGMLCFNSQIELYDIIFRRVSFFPVAAFENCTVAINQLTMSENSLFLRQSEANSLLHLKHSEVIIEDSKFEENTEVRCFWIIGGNTILKNIMFGSNNKVGYGRIIQAFVNIVN